MSPRTESFIAPIALMAAATGARTMVGVAAIGRTRSPAIARVVAAMALLELIVDKFPGIPNRTDRGAIAGRVVAGAVIGASIGAITGRSRAEGALIGAAFAFVSAHVTFRARRSLMSHLPPIVAAMVEDAAVVALARAGERLLQPGPKAPAT